MLVVLVAFRVQALGTKVALPDLRFGLSAFLFWSFVWTGDVSKVEVCRRFKICSSTSFGANGAMRFFCSLIPDIHLSQSNWHDIESIELAILQSVIIYSTLRRFAQNFRLCKQQNGSFRLEIANPFASLTAAAIEPCKR